MVGVTLQLYDHGAALAKKGACCAGHRHPRRAPRGRGDGLSALRAGLREHLPRRGDRRIRRQLSGGRDAGALHPLQRAGEVQGPAGNRPRPRRRLHGDRPLHPAQDGRARGRNCTGRRPGARPVAISCSRPRRSSSTSCAFRWAIWRPRPRPGRWPRGTGWSVADKPDSQDICFVPERRLCRGDREAAPRRRRAGRDRACRRPRAGPPSTA